MAINSNMKSGEINVPAMIQGFNDDFDSINKLTLVLHQFHQCHLSPVVARPNGPRAYIYVASAVLLLLFAAGLAGKAVHELRLLISWEAGWLVSSAWTLESGLFATGTFYDFMRGLFGWHKNPENIRVLAYFAYLIPVLLVYLRGSQSVSVPTTTNKEASQVV